jgi:hypothetical protein
MDALNESDELLLRSNELRARSVRMCAEASEKIEKSRRLIAAGARARQNVMRAYAWEAAGLSGRAAAADLPAGR